MTPTELLAYLHDCDIQLWIEGDRLRFKAPKGVLTPALHTQLAEHKEAILVLLRAARSAVDRAPAITVAPRDCELLPSYSQERMWLLDQLDHELAIFNIANAVHFAGRLELSILQQCLRMIVRRHEVLRTTFPTRQGRPVLRIAPAVPLALPVLDLSTLPDAARESVSRQVAAQVVEQPFDLANERLLRIVLLRLGSSEHVLLLATHHIVFDGWSSGLFQWELGLFYIALLTGQPSPFPDPPIQYTDYAVWQRRVLDDAGLEAEFAYWRRRLVDAPPLFGARPPRQAAPAARLPFDLPQQVVDALGALSRRTGASIFIVLLTAFKLVLSRFINQSDIVVGASITNRARTETERLIGFFANTVMLRTELSGASTFDEALRRVEESYLESYEHHTLPIERLLGALGQEHVEVLFNYVPNKTKPGEKPALPDVVVRPIQLYERPLYQYPHLCVALSEGPTTLYGALIYRIAIFSTEAIQQLMASYLLLLEELGRRELRET
jgi:Condensation domain/TubC N-terminal docking domain